MHRRSKDDKTEIGLDKGARVREGDLTATNLLEIDIVGRRRNEEEEEDGCV